MQKALESIFGPEAMALVGLVLMGIMIGPKFLNRWRGFRVREKGPTDCRSRITGQRTIRLKCTPEAESIEPHPDHGIALKRLHPNRINLIIEAVCWSIPLILVLLFVPTNNLSLHTAMLVMTIPLACFGLVALIHLWDSATFYKTGMTIRTGFRKKSFDYNSICEVTERKPLFFWMNSSFILHMDDEKLYVLDGSRFKKGDELQFIFRALDKRIKTNAMLD